MINEQEARSATGPVFLNGTSAGPRGNTHPRAGVVGSAEPAYAAVELSQTGSIEDIETIEVEKAMVELQRSKNKPKSDQPLTNEELRQAMRML